MSTKKDKFSQKDKNFMKLAISLARARKGLTGDNPSVGCIIVKNDKIISIGQTGYSGRPHAEHNAIKNSFEELKGSKMYVTLEPCALCATAIAFARIRKLVFGAYDPKGGGVEHGPRIFNQPTIHHAPEVIGGVMETKCASILKTFFSERRYKNQNLCKQ